MTASNWLSVTSTNSQRPKSRKANSKSTMNSLANRISTMSYWTQSTDNKICSFLYLPSKIIPSEPSSKTSKRKSPKSKNKKATFSRKCEISTQIRKNVTLKTTSLKLGPNLQKEFNKKSWSDNSRMKSCKRTI